MAEQSKPPGEPSGPVMLYLADVLAKPATIWASATFRRNFKLKGIVLAGVFAVLGLMVGAVVSFALGPRLFTYWGGIFGAILGYAVANTAPLRGETFGTWFKLLVSSRIGRVDIDGERCRLYLDIAPITDVEAGDYDIQPATVRVLPGLVDDRGLFIDKV